MDSSLLPVKFPRLKHNQHFPKIVVSKKHVMGIGMFNPRNLPLYIEVVNNHNLTLRVKDVAFN